MGFAGRSVDAAFRRIGKPHLIGLVLALFLGGCTSLTIPMNQPLRSPEGNTEYRLLDVNRIGGAQSALVLVALSGGGKRSAAFAFGVLRGMRDIPVRPEGRKSVLLDEVDLLAGVSGGSFPAAYYGLYGKRSFETFPDEFLYADIEAYIWGTFLLPWNWNWVVNPLAGTNDRMTWVYDKLMFHGATFADFYRRGRPQVSINGSRRELGGNCRWRSSPVVMLLAYATRSRICSAGAICRVFQPSILRRMICPLANNAQNSMQAVSAQGSMHWVLMRRLNSSCSRSMALVVRIVRHQQRLQ